MQDTGKDCKLILLLRILLVLNIGETNANIANEPSFRLALNRPSRLTVAVNKSDKYLMSDGNNKGSALMR